MIGSMVGWVGLVNCGLYCASKFAIRGMHTFAKFFGLVFMTIYVGIAETLHQEISPLGLRCFYIEPGAFRTDLLSESNRAPFISRNPDYSEIVKKADDALMAGAGKQPGDPKKFVKVAVDLIKGEGVAEGKTLPTGLPLGSDVYGAIKMVCEGTLGMLEEWRDVICSTDFPKGT